MSCAAHQSASIERRLDFVTVRADDGGRVTDRPYLGKSSRSVNRRQALEYHVAGLCQNKAGVMVQ